MMIDRNNVVGGLECCLNDTMCHRCPYNRTKDCHNQLDKDALKILSARVLTIDEVRTTVRKARHAWIVVEEPNIAYLSLYYGHFDKNDTFMFVDDDADIRSYKGKYYGRKWRCWNQMPTEEQMRAVKWDE